MLAERLQLETVRRMSAATITIPFEDLPNGVKAAKGRNFHGRRSKVTASLGLDGADLVAEERAELPLDELLVRF